MKVKTRPVVDWEDIEVGGRYTIEYKDPSYPCSCECHNKDSTMMHVISCCYDNSCSGPAICVSKCDDFAIFENRKRYYRINSSEVVRGVGA